MKKLLLTASLLFCIYFLGAQTFTTTIAGNYNTNSTWVSNSRPGFTISVGANVIINHALTFSNKITIRGNLTIGPLGSLTGNHDIEIDGGTVISNSLFTMKKLDINNSGRLVSNDSMYVSDHALIESNGDLIINGNAFFDKKLEIDGGDTLYIGGTIFIDDDFKADNNSVIVTGPSSLITADKKVDFKDVTGVFNGGLIVKDKFEMDDAELIFNGSVNAQKDIEIDGNSEINFNGNVFVAEDFKTNGNSVVEIGVGAIVQIVDELEADGNTITINGALIAGDGKENKGIINGTGLLQVDGGFDNDGTITGGLDICSSDASTNPISGNAVSGGASICSSAGINFPIIPAAPLPVVLLDFNAFMENNRVAINWSTAMELNNAYFTVYKSFDGIDFTILKNVNGNGSKNSNSNYTVFDDINTAKVVYYQLSQTDFDGKITFFKIIAVNIEIEKSINDLLLYPNPTNGNHINILSDSPLKNILSYEVYSQVGVLLNRGTISSFEANNHTIQFDSQLTAGIYFLRLNQINQSVALKFIVK